MSLSNLAIVNLGKDRFVIQSSTKSYNPEVLVKLRKKATDAAIKVVQNTYKQSATVIGV